jgi:predicted nucleic acid-binding protein
MILVDTSVWVDHFRHADPELTAELNTGRVYTHPWVIGELACGNLRARSEILALLKGLPGFTVVSDEEVFFFIERHQLMGRGIGFVDVQLLASTALSGVGRLWTRDKRLHAVAATLGLAHVEARH